MRLILKASRLTHLLVLVAAAVVLMSACGGGGGDGQESLRERDGLRLTLKADRAVYSVGDTVKLSAEVKNISDAPISYRLDPGEEVAFQLRVVSELGGTQVLNVDDVADDPETTLVLEDGKKLKVAVKWDQLLSLYQTPAQAPPGEYVVSARIVVGGPDGGTEPVEVTASLTLTLEGGREILAVRDAILLAVQHPALKQWAEDRGAAGSLCLYQQDQQYYSASLLIPQVGESFSNEYQFQVRNGDPICSPVSVDEEWRVQFLSQNGPPPNRVAVYMDLYTGENLRFEEGGF